jgi:hypothetical protein
MVRFILFILTCASVNLLAWAALAGVADKGDVLAACKRTKGCWSEPVGGGDIVGCSPHVCFYCQGDSCASMRHNPGGTSGLGGSDRVRILLSNPR